MKSIKLIKRSGRKTYSVWIDGRYISTGQTDERLARATARQIIAVGVESWKNGKRSLSQSLFDLIEEHLIYLRDVDGRAAKHISKKRMQLSLPLDNGQMRTLKDVTKSRVQAFLASLECGPKTRNEYQTAWNVFLDWLVYQDRLPENPIKGRIRRARVKPKDQAKRRHFTLDELDRLLTVAGKREAVYLIAAVTGARKGELEKLIWSNVREMDERPHVVLRDETAKNDKSRKQFLSTEAVEVFARMRVRADTDRVFQTMPSHHTFDKDLATAGIDKRTPDGVACFHSLRHTFTTISARVSKDTRIAQRMADHTDIKTTQRYMHTEADEVYAVVQQFPQLRATKRASEVFNRSQNVSSEGDLSLAESKPQVTVNDSLSPRLSSHVEHGLSMEPGGIEPPCRNGRFGASTRVVSDLISTLRRPLTAYFGSSPQS